MTMNQSDLIEAVADRTSYSRHAVEPIIKAAFDEIFAELEAGHAVSIVHFGKFEVVGRAARTGTNPQTGERLKIAPRKVPKFRPSRTLKEAVE